MASDVCMIFFRAGRGDLDAAASALRDMRLSVVRLATTVGDELSVTLTDGPRLRVAFADDGYVREEAEEIGEGTPHEAVMKQCGARYEVLIDDLDAALGEFTTLQAIQEALIELTDGVLFTSWNGNLWKPDVD